MSVRFNERYKFYYISLPFYSKGKGKASMPKEKKKLPVPEKKVRPVPVRPNKSIIKAMSSKKSDAFAGYGRHCINDFLYELAIYPGTPAYVICGDEKRYQEFKTCLHKYMVKYCDENKFLKEAATISKHEKFNPFAFNERSNRVYTSGYIHVFRRTTKRVPVDLYNRYVRDGLFDPKHTIGR